MPVKRPMCLICLVFLLCICIFTYENGPKPSWDVDCAKGMTVTVSGIVKDRQIKNETLQVYLSDAVFSNCGKQASDKTVFPEKSKGIIVKTSDTDALSYVRLGSCIEARGIFEPFDTVRCEGQFDMRAYYVIRGYDGQLKRARITGVSKNWDHVSDSLRDVRDKAFDILKAGMGEDDAALAAAMMLGDKSALTSEIKDLYQHAGISHVLALSGLHIASVGLAILAFLKKIGLPPAVAYGISATLIAAYAVMTGLSTSTVRAMIMFALFVLSQIIGRTYDLLSAAALSAILILVKEPYYVYDSGFLLSFGAVLGIACVYPVFIDMVPGAGKIYQSVCITLSVTIATFPVMGSGFMQISLCSVFINLVVIPLMGLVLSSGFAGIIIGFLGLKPDGILKITHYILKLYEFLSKISEKIDGNILIIGKPEKWQTVTYAIIVIIAVNIRNIKKLNNTRKTQKAKNVDPTGRQNSNDSDSYTKHESNKITYIIERSSDDGKKRKKKIAVSVVTIVMFAAAMIIMTLHPRCDLEIRNVDVGQGDCAVIWGRGVSPMIIDGGSSDISLVGKYRIEPVLKSNRIPVIEYCFLSHMDSDHVNGVIEMLEDGGCGITIRRVIVPGRLKESGSESENFIKLKEAAKGSGTDILAMSSGDVVKNGTVTVRCISPERSGNVQAAPDIQSTDENDGSLVLVLEYKSQKPDKVFRAVFTGDISRNVERGIIPELPDCTYLKVAHHGSRFSSSDDFLEAVHPKISVISAGVDNSYGHPHKETIERLDRCNTRVYRTDESGEIIVTLDNKHISVRSVLFDK